MSSYVPPHKRWTTVPSRARLALQPRLNDNVAFPTLGGQPPQPKAAASGLDFKAAAEKPVEEEEPPLPPFSDGLIADTEAQLVARRFEWVQLPPRILPLASDSDVDTESDSEGWTSGFDESHEFARRVRWLRREIAQPTRYNDMDSSESDGDVAVSGPPTTDPKAPLVTPLLRGKVLKVEAPAGMCWTVDGHKFDTKFVFSRS